MQQAVGQLFVASRFDGDIRRAAGDTCPHALLVLAEAELHQALIVQPDRGNTPPARLVDQRLGRRAERETLSQANQLVQLGAEVEGSAGLELTAVAVRRQELEALDAFQLRGQQRVDQP